jgi:hypothetical protein
MRTWDKFIESKVPLDPLAYQKGQSAFHGDSEPPYKDPVTGKTPSVPGDAGGIRSPYPPGSPLDKAWMKGWMQAYRQFYDD